MVNKVEASIWLEFQLDLTLKFNIKTFDVLDKNVYDSQNLIKIIINYVLQLQLSKDAAIYQRLIRFDFVDHLIVCNFEVSFWLWIILYDFGKIRVYSLAKR